MLVKTKTDVANLALGYAGVSQTIMDLDGDNTTHAKIIKRHIDTALVTFLESHPWRVATAHAKLALLSVDPDSGYRYSYTSPPDALIIRDISFDGVFTRTETYEENKAQFEEIITGVSSQIHTDIPEAHVEYTRILDINGAFPVYFARGFAAQLTKEIAPSLITNNFGKVKRLLMEDLDSKITEAIVTDMGRQPRKRDPLSPFLAARKR
jgi:hypothetical protein